MRRLDAPARDPDALLHHHVLPRVNPDGLFCLILRETVNTCPSCLASAERETDRETDSA